MPGLSLLARFGLFGMVLAPRRAWGFGAFILLGKVVLLMAVCLVLACNQTRTSGRGLVRIANCGPFPKVSTGPLSVLSQARVYVGFHMKVLKLDSVASSSRLAFRAKRTGPSENEI